MSESGAIQRILPIERIVREKVDTYVDVSDAWRIDHEYAMLYFDFCELVKDGLRLYYDICRLDDNWRASVFSKEVEYSPTIDDRISELVSRFAKTSFSIESGLLPTFEHDFEGVDDAEKFRDMCTELRGIVTPDEEFFIGDKIEALRASAMESHHKGETVEYDIA